MKPRLPSQRLVADCLHASRSLHQAMNPPPTQCPERHSPAAAVPQPNANVDAIASRGGDPDRKFLSRPSSQCPKHELPLEIWSLVVTCVVDARSKDTRWRLHLVRLAHTCRSAYFAAFPVLWGYLHLQFVRNNTELAPAESTVVNAAEFHNDPHLEYRLAWIRHARKQFDAGMVFPSACTRAHRVILSRMASISECLLLAPLVIRCGMPYLVSTVESEKLTGGDAVRIRASIEPLWGPFLSAQPSLLDNVTIINGLVLVPYPLHLVKHIDINDLDTSVDLGTDLLHPTTHASAMTNPSTPEQEWPHSHHGPPPNKPSWTHVLPFLLQLPPSNIHSIRFLSSSPCASRLTAELVQRYPYAQDKEAVYSGDHEHRYPSMTSSTRNVRLFLDGDLDSAASSTPDLICIPRFENLLYGGDIDKANSSALSSTSAAPPISPIFKPSAHELTANSIEFLGRTSYLPFDEPGVGLHRIFTIPTLTRLVLDIDFEFDVTDAGSFPIHLPNLAQFTLTMRIAILIFARNQHIDALPSQQQQQQQQQLGQPAFPALTHMVLLNDLDPPPDLSPSVSSTSSSSSSPPALPPPALPPPLPLMPAIPFHHMPQLYEFTVPATFRGLAAPCAIDISITPPPMVTVARMPNVHFIGLHAMSQYVPSGRPPIFDSLVATYKRIETQYALRGVPFPNLQTSGLHVWDWQGDPRNELPWCTWKDQLREVEVVFDGPCVWAPDWMVGVAGFSRLTRLTVVQSVAVQTVQLAPSERGERVLLDMLEVLTVQFANARVVDFTGVAIGSESGALDSTRVHLPRLRRLLVHAPCTTHLPPPAQLALLRHVSVYGAPCPKLIQALLAAATIPACTTQVAFEAQPPQSPSMAATAHDHGFVYQARESVPDPRLTCCGSSESPMATAAVCWVFTRRNLRVWYALLTAAPMACAPTHVTIRIGDVLDVVDAGTVARAVANLAGECRGATRWAVEVDAGVARTCRETVQNARWVAEAAGGQIGLESNSESSVSSPCGCRQSCT
ncbi:hypothetical protein BCR44DRAFT_80436 [Catenaria anguillulae PL171]|uniref:Uncharacterized protein n=1 Tax=Catenaria anguillulae PL171 TaxID=765915 RepID=A0A1Y2HWW3_9FUNG|nr:hypothetical protein BCR44DRAFT_80436 [Catenaria anguillulae PL171]